MGLRTSGRRDASGRGRRCGGVLDRLPVLLALGLSWGPTAASAQDETIRSVRMSVVLSQADAQVILEVEVEHADGTETLPASLLDFGGTRLADLALGSAGAPAALRQDRGVSRVGAVTVEPGPTSETRLVLATYRVRGAVGRRGASLRAHVPVLSVDRPPTAATPGFFRAELRLPPEWSVTEGFPSGLRPMDRPGLYEVDLSVVPAVISFRGRVDGAWRPGVPLLLDILAGVLLLAFSAVGFRHLRAAAA